MVVKNKIFFGVHDYFNSQENKWSHIIHFHNVYDDMFRLHNTDNFDCFGGSLIYLYSQTNPLEDYESFRYGGYIYVNDKLEMIEKPGLTIREEIEKFVNENNGLITET
jgi:hypothetical protein